MMDMRVTDLAISEGRYAARRYAARFDPTPADQEEVILQAGARIEFALTEWCHGPAMIEEARAIMADTFVTAMNRPLRR